MSLRQFVEELMPDSLSEIHPGCRVIVQHPGYQVIHQLHIFRVIHRLLLFWPTASAQLQLGPRLVPVVQQLLLACRQPVRGLEHVVVLLTRVQSPLGRGGGGGLLLLLSCLLLSVLVEWLAVLVGVAGLWGCRVPLESTRVAVKVVGPRLPDHVVWHRPAQNLLHHGDVFPIVVRLE